MATPRVFISSTCYDLQEVRFQLRQFIEDFGFEPVMSDFGDIFYSFNQHVQDACKDEIEKSNLFILIVGNSYGSIYHNHQSSSNIPDSVTLQEFRKALDTNKPKHIFINKYVYYDFQNYKRLVDKKLRDYFSENIIEESEIEKTKNMVKSNFDSAYPFPQDSYKYIFYFLSIIDSLNSNNAVFTFEAFDDIKLSLKKQWSGLMYDALVKPNFVSIGVLTDLNDKIDKIEQQIKTLVASKLSANTNDSKVEFDLSKLINELSFEGFEELKSEVRKRMKSILRYDNNHSKNRIIFRDPWSNNKANKWLDSLESLVNDYKWSKDIDVNIVFDIKLYNIGYDWVSAYSTVSYNHILEMSKIWKTISQTDKQPFITTITRYLNENYTKKEIAVDDLPF